MSNSDAVSKVLGSFGGQLGLVNTGMGMKNADGMINVSDTLQGIAATTESQFALAGKSYGPVQAVIGAWGIYNVYEQVKENYEKTGNVEVTGAQWSSLAGNGLNVVMGAAKSTPWGAGLGVLATAAEYGFNLASATRSPALSSWTTTVTLPVVTAERPSLNSWTDVKTLANEFIFANRDFFLNEFKLYEFSPQLFAKEIAQLAPVGVNPLDAWFAAYVAASSVSPGDSSSSSGSDFGGPNGFAGNTTDGGGWGLGENGGMLAPIVIDLDGDGVEIKPLDRSTTFFDADSDAYKERTAWVGADDGLLVIDLNGDGQVSQSKEMAFGEWTTETDTDLQALAKVFDSNKDGTFDSRDARFAEFRIWKDANSNGVADAGEMMTLQAAGIAANDILYRRCA